MKPVVCQYGSVHRRDEGPRPERSVIAVSSRVPCSLTLGGADMLDVKLEPLCSHSWRYVSICDCPDCRSYAKEVKA